jgi:hypothetical protein
VRERPRISTPSAPTERRAERRSPRIDLQLARWEDSDKSRDHTAVEDIQGAAALSGAGRAAQLISLRDCPPRQVVSSRQLDPPIRPGRRRRLIGERGRQLRRPLLRSLADKAIDRHEIMYPFRDCSRRSG